jgi:hypothetical protein
VCRRLFQRLQHRIERIARQHVHFVDDVHLEAPAGWRIQRVLQQFAHIVDLRIRSGVEFDQVDKAAAVDFSAGAAFAAGRICDAVFAIQGFGNNARQRGLAHAARAGEQVGVMQTLLLQGVAQRTDDMLLSDQFGEKFGTPLAGEYLGHGEALIMGTWILRICTPACCTAARLAAFTQHLKLSTHH